MSKKDKKEEKKVEPETKEEVKEEATKEKVEKEETKEPTQEEIIQGLLVQLDKAKYEETSSKRSGYRKEISFPAGRFGNSSNSRFYGIGVKS